MKKAVAMACCECGRYFGFPVVPPCSCGSHTFVGIFPGGTGDNRIYKSSEAFLASLDVPAGVHKDEDQAPDHQT